MRNNLFKKQPARRVSSLSVKGILLVFFTIAALFFFSQIFEIEKPQIKLLSDIKTLNPETEIHFALSDRKRGIRQVTISLEQAGKNVKVYDQKLERQGNFKTEGPRSLSVNLTLKNEGIRTSDGEARLMITVQDYSLWGRLKGNTTSSIYPVTLDATPPALTILDTPASLRQGSVGIVVYLANETIEQHGVLLNDNFHPGFPLPDRGDNAYGVLFSTPFDTKKTIKAFLQASDRAGNMSSFPFGVNLRSLLIKEDEIHISEDFLERKIPEFGEHYPEMTESMIDKYIYINREVRRLNNDRIKEICSKSAPEKLWNGKFNRMARSSRKASFADKRQYFYMGRLVDETVHLGIDLASVRHADVQAANRGEVVFADYLGIYGNMVILDHGIGVFSLYSHLSQIFAAKGDVVSSGAVIGKTGTSGMAGGDHLHLSMLVNGIFVNPVEWWDSSWVNLNILQYLNDV